VEHEQFEELYARHASDLLGFLVYRTGDRALAEDILADTFERVLGAKRGFDRRRGSEKTWLYSIALNRLRDLHRRAGAESRAVAGSGVTAGAEATDPEFGRVHDRDLLSRGLAALSTEEREAIALRFGGEMTAPEIAALTGEKLTTIEGRIYRALGKLRSALGRDAAPESDARSLEG
jgi:RNA polymerase sigma-70 factor (ECF subfamily)